SQHNQDMQDALQHWPSVFTNVSVISNRTTPFHRDPHSRSDWYDMLVTVGDYEDCVLDIPTLGLQFLYNPGTVVAFSGRLLRHGVSSVGGNRCCFAYYMRDNIHNWIGIPCGDWMRVQNVWTWLMPAGPVGPSI
ncbi:hypothetical protein M404DRAFT_167622, partial [Pisolithus tinctorius Marx 270]